MKKCEALMLDNDGDYTRPCLQNAKEEVAGTQYCKRHATFRRRAITVAVALGFKTPEEMEEANSIETAEAEGKERAHGKL